MDDFTAELRQGLDPTPEGTLSRRMARVDGCPECVANTEPPQRIADETESGFVAHYRCADCGHRWQTYWGDINWEGLFA